MATTPRYSSTSAWARRLGQQPFALGIEQYEKVRRAFAVANFRLLCGGAAGGGLAQQRQQAVLSAGVVAEGVFRFLQRQQHLLLITGERGVGIRLGTAQTGAHAASRTPPS